MSNPISRTASTALSLAGGTASKLTNSVHKGVSRWVPSAVKTVAVGAQLAVLRDGSRKVAKVVKRNPVATVAVVATAAGAGVALWLLRRNKQRRGLDELMYADDIEPLPAKREPVAKRAPRKTAAKKSAAKVSPAGE